MVSVAVVSYRLTLDVLHDKVRGTALGCSSIEESGDVGMISVQDACWRSSLTVVYRTDLGQILRDPFRHIYIVRP